MLRGHVFVPVHGPVSGLVYDEGMKEEVFLPYPKNPVATSFSATWLSSSLKAARERGLLDKYLSHLPARYHDQVLHSVPGTWLPVDVAVAHYEAMDALPMADDEIVRIGEEVTERFHGVFFSTVFRLARAAGATPWSMFTHSQRMWDRTWVGGGIAIFKAGPRDARGEFVGWPCARVRYCRVAMRGMMLGTVALFCKKATVLEIPSLCTDMTLGYRMQWVLQIGSRAQESNLEGCWNLIT
ncbi:MAG: hypothetical protein U0165_13155 [Polyangiaceae bacterium]